jgi:hypothetical protein
MTNEEIERRMEFIIDQQAQFASDIQVLREIQAADTKMLKEQYRQLSDSVIAVVGIVGKLAEAQERADARVAQLAAALEHTDNRVSELAERLNIFIDVVEKYISRNGSSDKH